LATLILRKVGHTPAVTALQTIRAAESFNVLHLESGDFDRSCAQFARYDDQHNSYVDHTSSVLADGRDVDHVFTFDGDFHTLGFTVVPGDTGETGKLD